MNTWRTRIGSLIAPSMFLGWFVIRVQGFRFFSSCFGSVKKTEVYKFQLKLNFETQTGLSGNPIRIAFRILYDYSENHSSSRFPSRISNPQTALDTNNYFLLTIYTSTVFRGSSNRPKFTLKGFLISTYVSMYFDFVNKSCIVCK